MGLLKPRSRSLKSDQEANNTVHFVIIGFRVNSIIWFAQSNQIDTCLADGQPSAAARESQKPARKIRMDASVLSSLLKELPSVCSHRRV